jgi:hypothetical protein
MAKLASKDKIPTLILCNDFGIDLDSYNWKLYHQHRDKNDVPTTWRVIGNYPTLFMLAEGIQRRCVLVDYGKGDLPAHLKAAIAAIKETLDILDSQLDNMGVGMKTKPAVYADYALTLKESQS